MRSPSVSRAQPLEVKMTPMIDVVFLLLVFFIWTSSFELPEFDLPGSIAEMPGGGAESASESPLQVEIFDEIVIRLWIEDGGIVRQINGQTVDDDAELRRRISEILALGVQPPVIVDPDDAVIMQVAIGAYDAARAAGADRVLFTARDSDVPPVSR